MSIEVEIIKSEYQLGTQDGSTYRISPIDDCDCEPNFTCFVHAGYFTEKH